MKSKYKKGDKVWLVGHGGSHGYVPQAVTVESSSEVDQYIRGKNIGK